MRWPEVIEAGREAVIPVCQTDIFATIAEITGFDIPDNIAEDSYSLLPVMKSNEYDRNIRGPVIHHSVSGHFAIRSGDWKLNMLRGSGGSLKPRFLEIGEGDPPFELYNIV